MSRSASPLRYPGGKASLFPMVSHILRANNLHYGQYIEPFAGGAGLALSLLYAGEVAEIHINDCDPAIYAFWYSVLYKNKDFVQLINETSINLDEWHKQKSIYKEKDTSNLLFLGFSAFFLNRTNRSGVIDGAGVIGGLSQKGTYKIDCRFNKKPLIQRIERLSKYREQIFLYNEDAIDFINNTKKILNKRSFFCIDPPYFRKGSSLYTNFYNKEDHKNLSKTVLKLNKPWIVTYDVEDEIKKLYSKVRKYNFNLKYSLQQKRIGNELLILSNKVVLPAELNLQAL